MRKLSPEEQDVIREQAIRLFKKGMKIKEIASLVGAGRNAVGRWCEAYKTGGAAALKSGKRGTRPGDYRTLSPEEESDIRKCIVDKAPDQFKLTFALWTRQAVRDLVRLRTGITMPIRTVGLYLQRWGFTPQKPLKRAYEQRPADVSKWLEEEYPAIAEKAAKEGGEIHWGDETGVRSDDQRGRSYAPKGKTPAIRLSARRTSLNMISTVTNQGKVRFMVYKQNMNAQLLIAFMKRLIKDADRKVFLILDNLKVHHAHIVRAWLAQNADAIEVYYLPSYSPELNPDEYLNCDLKLGVHSRPPPRDIATLRKYVISHMRKLQNLPDRVMRYFRHRAIAYAG